MALQLPEAMIRDTVAAVFSDSAYGRTTLLQRLGRWLLELVELLFSKFRPGGLPTPVFWTVVSLSILIALAVLARFGYGIYQRRQAALRGAGEAGFGRGVGFDAWAAARLHAAMGDYTAAAHALYLGVLYAIARRGEVELHESKTIGDYLRDLAARSSAQLSRFREFARSYETVIYGTGFCDRDRYERLLGLAHAIVETGG